jgi:hypothetical protein
MLFLQYLLILFNILELNYCYSISYNTLPRRLNNIKYKFKIDIYKNKCEIIKNTTEYFFELFAIIDIMLPKK